jgi:hypothetical protein
MSNEHTSGRDPFDAMTEPALAADAAGYLIEMLASMAHFAHISNLHNSGVMLAAASRVVEQECRLVTDGPPEFRGDPPQLPFPFNQTD